MTDTNNSAKQITGHHVLTSAHIIVLSLLDNDLLSHDDISYGWDACEDCPECYKGNTQDCQDRMEVEVLEWYLVSKWLYTRLKAANETTANTKYGYLWGRTTYNQTLYQNHIIRKIAEEADHD